MLRNHKILGMILFILFITACKKSDPGTGENPAQMQDLKVPAGFSWETSRDVTFQITSPESAVITITSAPDNTRFYKGFYNRLSDLFTVKLNIPYYMQHVRVNGIDVPISGDVVNVSLSGVNSGSHTDGAAVLPMDGLIAAWHFDENSGNTANDAVGGHHGVITGAGWVSGIRGSALAFDGTGNQVQVPNAGFNPVGGQVSFSFWFRLNAVGNSGAFIFQNVKYIVKIDPQGRIGFALYTPLYEDVVMAYTDRILNTDWHHVALTYDGSDMKIYLDGMLKASGPNTGNLHTTTSDVYIGYQKTLNPFTGIIDEMLVYDKSLTENEILQLYTATPDPGNGSADLVSYWNLDENAGTTANDPMGGNTGVITSAAWAAGVSGSCLQFDGSAGLVKAPNKPNLNPVNEITMMAWAKTRENKTSKIFQKGDWDGHGLGQGKWDGWNGHIRIGDVSHLLHWGGGLPIVNEWYHLAMTYDGQTMKFYINGQLKNSKPVTGSLKVTGRDLSIGSDNGVQKFFNGSIDELKFFNRALDITEIQANYAQTGTSPDQDGDGIPDADDAYPKDPARAFDNFHPAVGFGTLAFEDLWPGKGDYDFNDLVLDYRFKTVTNMNNKVTEVVATFVIRAIGAGLQNGFGFQLPGAGIAGADVEVTGYRLKEGFISLNPNGTEAGQEKITVIVYDNVSKIMPSPGGFGVNVQPGAPYLDPDTTVVSILFKPDTYTTGDIGLDQFNPFLIVNLDRGKEVHLPDHAPTSLVNAAYFNTGEDDSDPATGRYYKTQNNLPWAIRISTGFDYTVEGVQITSAYLKFATWAESAGVRYPDWYLKTTGYRNEPGIYQVP